MMSLIRKASPMQVYMRGPRTQENQPLHEYTLMPMRMTSLFSVKLRYFLDLSAACPSR